MKKSTLLMTLALILSITLGIGGTMAYLQDTDEDVNVMTLGNVHIEQIEKERIEQSDDKVTPDNIQDFTQGKPLYPVVGTNAWAESNQQWPTGGSSQMHNDELKNVVDKFVFVENTGKSDAYVRTIFAFEAGKLTFAEWDKMMHWNINGVHWDWNGFEAEEATLVTIDGNNYFLVEALYLGNAGENKDVHQDGILAPGETTRPSLLQFWMDWEATNETMEAIDGNGNGTYDILVVSQAVQTMGFSDAQTALDAAFGDITKDNHPWLGEAPNDAPTEYPFEKWEEEADTSWYNNTDTEFTLSTAAELAGLAQIVNDGTDTFNKKTIKLGANVDLGDNLWAPIGTNADSAKKFRGTFDGQNHTISNLKIEQGAAYHAAGFFGALNGTAKNFTIDGAKVTSLSSGDPTDNGIAVVAGSIYTSGTIENVNVVSAEVYGNRYTAGIAGYVYGSIIDCTVEDTVIVAATDDLTGSYNNGDKVGGIAGYAADHTVSGCKVVNVKITGYRDVGGVVGYAHCKVENCSIENVELTQDNTHNYKNYATKEATDVKSIVGEKSSAGSETNCTGTATILYPDW